jgi:hypothetical protein
MIRVTFSLDTATVERIRKTAARLRKPQSQVIREAVAEYASRSDRLSDSERLRVLGVLERLRTSSPTRGADAVDRELHDLRASRRQGGRRHRRA